MQEKIIVALRWVLSYLWTNKDPLIELWKEIRKDGKLTFSDLKAVFDFYEKSGFIPEENDEVFVGAISEMKENKSKNLVQYNQSNYSCAIYSRTRSVMYNVKGLVYTKDEVEAIVKLAKEKGYLKTTGKSKGMTFANADKVIKEWTLKNKNILLKYDKVPYGSDVDLQRQALGYARSIGGGISGAYIKDFRVDGKIDPGFDYGQKILYYHAWTREPDGKCTENYPKQFGNNNRYENDYISEFIEKKIFFRWSYYITSEQEVKTDTIEEMKNEDLFKDVKGNAEFYDSIKWAKENGIVNGYQDGNLKPKENLKVDRFLAILYNYDKTRK